MMTASIPGARHAGKRAGRRLGRARYFFSRGGADVLSAGVEPYGASGLVGAGAFFGFFASLLPR